MQGFEPFTESVDCCGRPHGPQIIFGAFELLGLLDTIEAKRQILSELEAGAGKAICVVMSVYLTTKSFYRRGKSGGQLGDIAIAMWITVVQCNGRLVHLSEDIEKALH
jgi:hypothetical protein